MHKRVIRAVAMLLLLALLPTPGVAAQRVSVAYMPNYASLFSVVTGIRMGYFADEGLEVNLVEFADGPTIIAAMENGSIDMGYIGPGRHKLCIQGYAKIFCMSHMGNADAVLGIRSHGVTQVTDLKGKRVGYASGTSSEIILGYALADAGLTMADVELIEMDASALVTATLSGSIDACAAWSPSTAIIRQKMGDDIAVLAENATFADRSASIASWIVANQYSQNHAETVLAFTRALYRAMDYHKEHMEETCRWVAEMLGESYETVWAQRTDGFWLDHAELVDMVQSGEMEKQYALQQNSFLTAGVIERIAPVASYVLFDNMLTAAQTLNGQTP